MFPNLWRYISPLCNAHFFKLCKILRTSLPDVILCSPKMLDWIEARGLAWPLENIYFPLTKPFTGSVYRVLKVVVLLERVLNKLFALGMGLSSNTCRYTAPSVLPPMMWGAPLLCEVRQTHTIIPPPPCFTVWCL